MNNTILIGLIGLFFGSLGTFVVLTRFFRRYLQISSLQRQEYEQRLEETLLEIKNQKHEIEAQKASIQEQRKAIQELIYQFHHSGANPLAKRFRGAGDLGMRPIESLRQCLVLLRRPNHERWADIAETHVNEIETWWKKGIELCFSMELEVKKVVKKFDRFNNL